ncbi:hypothetical protein PLICRDRAFT_34448 [Plicaturopsis crispa FD-325 SS-3]|nr:hypothetical protein PLICRDRAFT_34448 [Plicaturopsis crispa FD-325 SS-3]
MIYALRQIFLAFVALCFLGAVIAAPIQVGDDLQTTSNPWTKRKISLPKVTVPKATPKAKKPTAVKTTTAKATKTTAAKKTTSAAATTSAASKTSVAASKTSASSSSASASSSAASCPLPAKKGKVASRVDAACLPETTVLTLGTPPISRTATKSDSQGNSAIVYDVTGGWPDINGNIQGALAKTGKNNFATFDEEKGFLAKVDQLLAEGKTADGREWLIIAKQSGVPLLFTAPFQAAIGTDKCATLLKEKVDIVVNTAQKYVEQYGVFHKDLQPENVFWNADATQATLIDWGTASDVGKTFTPALKASALAQATFSFRDSCNAANKL